AATNRPSPVVADEGLGASAAANSANRAFCGLLFARGTPPTPPWGPTQPVTLGRNRSVPMTYETLELTRDGAALRVVLNRPGVLNALSEELLGDLRSVLEGEAADESVRAVLITGAGRGFCAGADLGSTEVGAGIGEILEERYNP